MLSIQWVFKKKNVSNELLRGEAAIVIIVPNIMHMTQLPRTEPTVGRGDESFPILEFASPSIKLDFYFLAPSVCEMEMNWPVSKGPPCLDILGSDTLMFISLTGLLFFPRAGEAGLA